MLFTESRSNRGAPWSSQLHNQGQSCDEERGQVAANDHIGVPGTAVRLSSEKVTDVMGLN